MAKNLNILLLENVTNLGKAGDTVIVSEGYARNMLFPKGMAALATEKIQQEQKQKKTTQEKQKNEELKKFQKKADELDGTELAIEAKVKDGNEIYGSITKKNIAEKLNEQIKLSVQTNDIDIKPIKTLGTHQAAVKLSDDVEFQMNIVITPDKESREKQEE